MYGTGSQPTRPVRAEGLYGHAVSLPRPIQEAQSAARKAQNRDAVRRVMRDAPTLKQRLPRRQGEGAAAATQCVTMRGSLDTCSYRFGVSEPDGAGNTARLVLFSVG